MKGNSDDRDGTNTQHRGEEKGIKVGSLSHDRKSALVSALFEEFKCEIFKHSMYSTDRAPSDYHLFLHIEKFLAGQRLGCDQNTKQVLQDWLKSLATNFFKESIQNLVPR
jgi:hypothetical protein